jgi:hypothetical protein
MLEQLRQTGSVEKRQSTGWTGTHDADVHCQAGLHKSQKKSISRARARVTCHPPIILSPCYFIKHSISRITARVEMQYVRHTSEQ